MDTINILNIPFDFGQDHIGVRLAGDYLKNRGLSSRLSKFATCRELGDMTFPLKVKAEAESRIKNHWQCTRFNQMISERIKVLDLTDSFQLNLGGDHGMALGTIHGMLHHDPHTVVVWADAHGDINTPVSSPSGNFHGMPLAFLLGEARNDSFSWLSKKLIPKNLIYFGPRDLDQGEREIINRLGIQYFSSDEINHTGAKEIMDMALHRADPTGVHPIHLSFDVDLFDAQVIKATGTRVLNGPRQEEVFLMGGLLGETGRLRSMDVVEFNPLIGTKEEVEESCELLLRFLESTLGQTFQKECQKLEYRFSTLPFCRSHEDEFIC